MGDKPKATSQTEKKFDGDIRIKLGDETNEPLVKYESKAWQIGDLSKYSLDP